MLISCYIRMMLFWIEFSISIFYPKKVSDVQFLLPLLKVTLCHVLPVGK